MLPDSTVIKGRYAEGAVRRKLEELGFIWTIRSYASHGPIDLLATDGKGVTWAVQVKGARRNGGYLSAENLELLKLWSGKFGAKPVLAFKKKGKWIFKPLSQDLDSTQSEIDALSILEELADERLG
jgi:Holliday junction resolvase